MLFVLLQSSSEFYTNLLASTMANGKNGGLGNRKAPFHQIQQQQQQQLASGYLEDMILQQGLNFIV